jgi:hypothetical protein
LQYHATKKSPPHLSFGQRSYSMKELLTLVGIRSKIIDDFQIQNGVITPQTLLEVYSTDTDRWFLQDPDFNVEYKLESKE